MMKKVIFIFAIAAMALSTSCKQDNASSKIDADSEAIAPASLDAVIAPDANISAAPENPNERVSTSTNGKYPVMSFKETEHNFGDLKSGDNVSHVFTFTNTGDANLLISDARGSCGCTVPEFPKAPIKPGESGKIKVSFNSAGKHGQQHKTVTIIANTAAGKEKLDIKASIAEKATSGITN